MRERERERESETEMESCKECIIMFMLREHPGERVQRLNSAAVLVCSARSCIVT